KFMNKVNFYNRGQSLIGIIIVLIVVGLISSGLYYYRQKQIPEIPEITEKPTEKVTPEEQVIEDNSTKPSSPQVYLSSLLPGQGDTLLIRINSEFPINEANGKLNSQKINFFKLKKGWMSIIGISVKKKLGKYNLVINFSNGETFKKELKIIERKFPIEEFLVSEELKKEGYTQSKIVEELVSKEKPLLDEIFKVFTPRVYFDKPFIYPLEKIEVTGNFGAIRKNGGTAIQHLGVDLKADVGTPVYAINDGVVLFSQETKMYGKTIIIDHGFSIFSLYCHLSEFEVSNGEEVKRGEIVGLFRKR
ncbi:unnamed protein product, partial [marine sediment metagenome]